MTRDQLFVVYYAFGGGLDDCRAQIDYTYDGLRRLDEISHLHIDPQHTDLPFQIAIAEFDDELRPDGKLIDGQESVSREETVSEQFIITDCRSDIWFLAQLVRRIVLAPAALRPTREGIAASRCVK